MGKIEEIINTWRIERTIPYPLTLDEIISLWIVESSSNDVKINTIKEYGKRYHIRTFIETGTWQGETIQAMLAEFDQIFSIELQNNLYQAAVTKFALYPHIQILNGDSGQVLPQLLTAISQPCLFWLDGHYIPQTPESARGVKDTPILEELYSILNHSVRDHVVLIDDARCFIGPNLLLKDYPTIKELKEYVFTYRTDVIFEVRDDIIRIHRA